MHYKKSYHIHTELELQDKELNTKWWAKQRSRSSRRRRR